MQAKAFLTPDEMARFEAFLEVRGAKKGPYIRQLILRELAKVEGHGDGSVQVRELAEAMRMGQT